MALCIMARIHVCRRTSGLADNSEQRLTFLATCLLLFPRFLLFLSTPPAGLARESLTSLEQFLATQLGIGLIVVSFTLVTSVSTQLLVS